MTTTPPNYVRHTKKAEWGLGQLVESEAAAADEEIAAAMKRAVVDAPNDYATKVTARVSRTTDVLGTGTMSAAISILPKGSINTVTSTITYTRGA